MRLYGGCYERFLFGFELSSNDGSWEMDQVLSIPAHKNAVKCIDTSGNFVVTGGADDQLHLFNMRTNADLGFLVNPAEGAVPCVAFVRPSGAAQPTHLLSGSVGGEICVWRAEGQWEHMKGMKGHQGIVNGIATHPSGAIALSVSRDKQMRLWDLSKGSCAHQAPLAAQGDLVGFFASGDTYYVASSDPSTATGSKVSLHSIKGDTMAVLPHTKRVLAITTSGDHTVIVGCEGGSLVSWDTRRPSQVLAELPKAHRTRIRGLSRPFALSGDSSRGQMVASASSDGVVKTWDVDRLTAGSTSPAAEVDGKARFTCLCAFDESKVNRTKRNRKQAIGSAGKVAVVGGHHNEQNGPESSSDDDVRIQSAVVVTNDSNRLGKELDSDQTSESEDGDGQLHQEDAELDDLGGLEGAELVQQESYDDDDDGNAKGTNVNGTVTRKPRVTAVQSKVPHSTKRGKRSKALLADEGVRAGQVQKEGTARQRNAKKGKQGRHR